MWWTHLFFVFLFCYLPVIISDSIHSDRAFHTKEITCELLKTPCKKDIDCEEIIKDNVMCTKNKKCSCETNYELKDNCTLCQKCPVTADPCNNNFCCDPNGENTKCYKDACESCPKNGGSCGNHSLNQDILLTATQIAMCGTLILGIITILILLWKLCSETRYGRRSPTSSRARDSGGSSGSGGSLQRVVRERMRDAPPPYCRALPPPEDTPPPYHLLSNSGYVNASFEGDLSLPPPDYTTVMEASESPLNSSSSVHEETHKSDASVAADNLGAKNNEIVFNSSILHI